MDVGLLVIVVSDPAAIDFSNHIPNRKEDKPIFLSSNLPFNVNIGALFTRNKLTVHERYIFRVPNDHANFVFLGHGRADVDRRLQRNFAYLKHVDPHFQSTLIARESTNHISRIRNNAVKRVPPLRENLPFDPGLGKSVPSPVINQLHRPNVRKD